MTWAAIVSAVLALLGPLLQKWLAELLARVQAKLDAAPGHAAAKGLVGAAEPPAEAPAAVNRLFDEALAEQPWRVRTFPLWTIRGRHIERARTAALAHAHELDGDTPAELTAAEKAELSKE